MRITKGFFCKGIETNERRMRATMKDYDESTYLETVTSSGGSSGIEVVVKYDKVILLFPLSSGKGLA